MVGKIKAVQQFICFHLMICLFSSHKLGFQQLFKYVCTCLFYSAYFPVVNESHGSCLCLHLFVLQWQVGTAIVCQLYLHHAPVQPHHQGDAARCSFTLTAHTATSAGSNLTGVWCYDSLSHLVYLTHWSQWNWMYKQMKSGTESCWSWYWYNYCKTPLKSNGKKFPFQISLMVSVK